MVTEILLTPMTIFYEAKKLNTKLQVLKVCRPVQIFRYTLRPGTSLKSSGQVWTHSQQVPLLYPPLKTETLMLHLNYLNYFLDRLPTIIQTKEIALS